jgi:ribose 5-phosphate isomerase B
MMKIGFGSDHGALELKESLMTYLKNTHKEVDVIDLGTHTEASVDYPDYADLVVKAIKAGEIDCGILMCGTGIGISIRANRYKGIRAALVNSDFMAEMAKAHNNANILCFGGRTTEPKDANRYVDIWLKTDFEGGRHQSRLDKLDA